MGTPKEKENILLCRSSTGWARDGDHHPGPRGSNQGTQEPAAGAGCPGMPMLRIPREVGRREGSGVSEKREDGCTAPAQPPSLAALGLTAKHPPPCGAWGGSSPARAQLNVLLLDRPQTGLLQGRMSLSTLLSSERRCTVQAAQQHQHAFEGEKGENTI